MKTVTVVTRVERRAGTGPPPADDPWTDYYEVLHDQFCSIMYMTPRMLHVYLGQTNYAHQKPTIGYPGVVPLQSVEGRQGAPLTGEILWFLFDLCVHKQYGFYYGSAGWTRLTRDQKRKIASEFETFYDSKRFITNNAGIDENYNPIGEAVLGQPHRSGIGRQLEVVTTGSLVKAVSHRSVIMLADDIDPETGQVEKRRTPCIEIVVWNGTDPAPDPRVLNGENYPYLVHEATNTTPFRFDGSWSRTGPWRVDPFHFFAEKGSPYVVYSRNRQFIALNRVRRLRRSELAAWRDAYYPHRR